MVLPDEIATLLLSGEMQTLVIRSLPMLLYSSSEYVSVSQANTAPSFPHATILEPSGEKAKQAIFPLYPIYPCNVVPFSASRSHILIVPLSHSSAPIFSPSEEKQRSCILSPRKFGITSTVLSGTFNHTQL